MEIRPGYHSTSGVLGTNLTGVVKLPPAQLLDLLYSPLHLERESALLSEMHAL